MILSGTDDLTAPYRDAKRIYDLATGPKIIAALVGGNQLTIPRFWYGAMTAFFLTHLAGNPVAEEYVWGPHGLLESSPRIAGAEHDCGGWRSANSDVCR